MPASRPLVPLAAVLAVVFAVLPRIAAAVPAPPGAPADDAALAEADYQRYCALCHGKDREGHANDAAPSLKSKSLLESGWPRTIDQTISYGRPGTPMGGYLDEVGGPMTRDEIMRMTRWLGQQAAVPAITLPHTPVAGDIVAGERVYQASCASCHGAKGEGGEGTALGNAAMLALTSDAFLRHAIVEGRQDTPMPAFGGTLSGGQIDDVVAYLRSRAGGWTRPAPLATPPSLDAMLLNPGAAAPDFALRDDLYVSADTLRRALDAGRSMVLLDTRVPSVWRNGHIAGAVPIPYYSGAEILAKLPRDGTWIVAYCECPRAAAESVVSRLRQEGILTSAVLYEGFQGWVAKGHPVVAGATPDGDGAAAAHGHAH